MKILLGISLVFLVVVAVGCGHDDSPSAPAGAADDTVTPAGEVDEMALPDDGGETIAESQEIVPGLSRRILEEGQGVTARAGQTAVVHYTGWLYDADAPDHHGKKFDSSRDRGQHFEFPLGSGRVIPGWDAGVEGMRVGEVRELTIAPEMGYGERGAGDVIPPGATLVFEVELAGLKDGATGKSPQ